MRTTEERRQLIADRRKSADRAERLWVRNEWADFDVWTVPVDALVLNVDNRRFRAERMWAEEQLEHALDPENNPDDEWSIESLLLDSSHRLDGSRITGSGTDDYEALKKDWLLRQQESAIWIRPDGTVRNGNRRLAMVKRLQREMGDTGQQWIDAIILDEDEIDEGTLLEMEQREQLTANFKVRYNDIDYLLALREAADLRDIDWHDAGSIDEVAGALQTMVEKSKAEVVRDLYAIKYMDIFLDDQEQPGQYHRLLRTLERFRDIGRMMQVVETDYENDADQVLQVLFAAVRANRPHGEIRQIRQMFRKDRDRFDALSNQIAEAEEQFEGASPQLESPTETPSDRSEDEDSDDFEEDLPGPQVTNYPKAQVATAIEVAIDGFATSRQEDLLQVLKEISNRFDAVDERLTQVLRAGDLDRSILDELEKVVGWLEKYRAELPGSS